MAGHRISPPGQRCGTMKAKRDEAVVTPAVPTFLREAPDGTVLELQIQPRAARNEVVGVHVGSLKIRLTAPPVEGEANQECLHFLAKVLGVPKTRLRLLQGHRSRRKSVLVTALSPDAVRDILKSKGIPLSLGD